jgi:glutaredoxin 3
MIRIFTTPDCPKCFVAKEWFKAKKLEIQEINVKGNLAATREMIQLSGARTVPVIQIGKRVLIGFNREEVEDALMAAVSAHKR